MKTVFTTLFMCIATAILADPEGEVLIPIEFADLYIPTSDYTQPNCIDIQYSCGGEECPSGIIPYEDCLENEELCIDITFDNTWFTDCSFKNFVDNTTGIDLIIEVGEHSVEIPFFLTSNEPFHTCIPFSDIFTSETYGYAFENVPVLKIKISRAFGIEGIWTSMYIIPKNSAVLGALVSEDQEGYIESETPIYENLCGVGSSYSVSTGTEYSISSQGKWEFTLGNDLIAGSFGISSTETYSGSINSGYSFTISEEDCAAIPSDCICCYDIYPVAYFKYSKYESIEYDCEGNSSQGDDVIVATHMHDPGFTAKPIEGCPTPIKVTPLKLFNNNNNIIASAATGTITVEEELDFDFYTLTWTGPNGFTATNETTLTNLPFGTYCYTLTHCGCEGPVDQGCVALCPGATPVSDWYYEENKELYCRNMSCEEAGEAVQECVDGVPCEDWQYDDQDEECFRDICFDGDLLFTEITEIYDIEYDYNESSEKCEVSIYCESGEASMTIEREPVFSDPFFDEDENTCFRYVICQDEEIAVEEVGIEDIEWSYDQDDGCIGKVACEEGSHNDAEVKGGDVITEYADWEYDLDEDCFRDVECSLDGDFEDEIREASEGEQEVEWFYDDDYNECFATVDCDDEEVENGVSDNPYFGNWDEDIAINDLECIRVAECGEENFVDTEESYLYWEVGDCEFISGEEEMYKPCWRVVECGNETFEDEEFWIPCDDNCAGYNLKQSGNQSSLNAAPVNTKMQRCGIEFEFSPHSDFLDLKIMPSKQTLSYTVIITHVGTGRLVEQVNGKSNTVFQHRIRLPSKGVYALTLLSVKSRLCNFKIIHL